MRCHRSPFTTEGLPGLTRRPPRDCGSRGNYASVKLLFKKGARQCSLRKRQQQQNHPLRLSAKPPSPEGPGAPSMGHGAGKGWGVGGRTGRGLRAEPGSAHLLLQAPRRLGTQTPGGRGGRGTCTGQHGAGAGLGPKRTAAQPLRRSAGQPPKWLLDSCVTNQSGSLQLRGLEQAGVPCEDHPAPCFLRSAPSRC